MTTSPIHIGKVVRHALVFNAQRWQGAPITMDTLLQTVADLFMLLAQRKLNYTLVGGIAMLQYVQGRNTEDIDIILNTTALKKLPEITIKSKYPFFARGVYHDLQIDFLLTKNPLFAKVQKTYTIQQPFFEHTISSATVEGLILLKLYELPSLYRQGNFTRVGLYENDVATLMFYHRPAIHQLVDELRPYLSEQDMAAIEEIVGDLERRIQRVQPPPQR
ncbi:hypothetical protein OSCT_1317 [Oscillochloris trichoides DG-6]|uniref:Nucleotidyl transferase AbiEii/AbiGii toxin family protein n=1 Tax=Oscillochloris trichoides DG-6 TaxID=765420 RepID=E1IDB6_9CHLR|nr:hypothetical protein [Oscillochloris trichoides]EFO80793.1 hypothetical protein OSCT_1317 [Oscillochloris trichoides DG-6]